jgi:hypothetical protein
MPADPYHPDQLAGEARFRADLVAYLDSLPVCELAELPTSRQQPLQWGKRRSGQHGEVTRRDRSAGAGRFGADRQ